MTYTSFLLLVAVCSFGIACSSEVEPQVAPALPEEHTATAPGPSDGDDRQPDPATHTGDGDDDEDASTVTATAPPDDDDQQSAPTTDTGDGNDPDPNPPADSVSGDEQALSFGELRYVENEDCSGISRGRFEPTVEITIQGPQDSRTVIAEVATGINGGTGLMCRAEIRDTEGMLFSYPNTAARRFWMFNTYVPLDIVFINEDGSVNNFVTMQPCPRRPGQSDSLWVETCSDFATDNGYMSLGGVMHALELPGGWFQRSGIVPDGDLGPGELSEVTISWTGGEAS